MAWLHAHPGRTLCAPSWREYGQGHAGSAGVPGLAVAGHAAVGRTFTLEIGNSSGAITLAAVLLGTAPGSLPLFGGTLLVDPRGMWFQPRLLAPAGGSHVLPVPGDQALACAALYAQVVVGDGGAAGGHAFTRGVHIVLGG